MTIQELMSLKGRRALITGASGNLGATIADTLAELGADLILVDQPGTDFTSFKVSLKARWGIQVWHYHCDLEQNDQRLELLESIKNFLDVPGCVFVLAVDYEVVQQGMKEKLGVDIQKMSGKSFFDKIKWISKFGLIKSIDRVIIILILRLIKLLEIFNTKKKYPNYTKQFNLKTKLDFREIIIDGQNGLLVKLNDINSLTNNISRLLVDSELSNKIRYNGLLRSLEFDSKKISLQWLT